MDFKIKKLDYSPENNVPHVGWNEVCFKKNFGNFKKLKKYDFYFDHSYALMGSKYSLGVTNHTKQFSSIIQISNILACQFHPEKVRKMD